MDRETLEDGFVKPGEDFGHNKSCITCERIKLVLLMELPRNNPSEFKTLRVAFYMRIVCVAYSYKFTGNRSW
jgi:hypothetical protein